MKLCAIIPAAGRGSRLGVDRPKILVPVAGEITIWDVLKSRLQPYVDHIHVVLSPAGLPFFIEALRNDSSAGMVSTSVQPEPRGMGDAIFCGLSVWEKAENILIIWGDQVHVSTDTLTRCTRTHLAGRGSRCTLPVVQLTELYVEYVFDSAGRLVRVLQTREGDVCHPGGFGDVGTFLLSTEGLPGLWQDYAASVPTGAVTGELNFLPFLVFLSKRGWRFKRVMVPDGNEARGINTPADLDFFRSLYTEYCYANSNASDQR